LSKLSPVLRSVIEIEKNGMGGACSAYGGEFFYRVRWETLRERDHWIGPGIDGRIILRRIFRKWDVVYGLD
jgi:hypothetical protein